MADYKVKQAWPGKAARRPPKRERGEQVRAHAPTRRRATMRGWFREGPTLKRGSKFLMANSVSCVQDACCSFLCATRRVLLLPLCASHFSQRRTPLALPEPALALLNKTFSFFSPSCRVRLAKSSVGRHHTFFHNPPAKLLRSECACPQTYPL